MGQTARLRLIRDRFIAGHSSCELRRYLDSVPPETPIHDVVDRCGVWESHADPEIRRVSKPGPEPTYPAYVVDESYNGVDEVRVATVNKPSSFPNQVEELLGRLLAGLTPTAPVPALVPEVPMVDKLLQRRFRPSLWGWRNCSDHAYRDSLRDNSFGHDPLGGVGMRWCVFHVESRVMGQTVAPPGMIPSHLCCRDGGPRRHWLVS